MSKEETSANRETAEALAAFGDGGVITDATWESFEAVAIGALGHMIDGGEEPVLFGDAVSKDEAAELTKAWLDTHKATLVGGGVDFARSLVNRLALVDEPTQSDEEFEAGLVSLTTEQLVILAERLADRAEVLKQDVIDRRRVMVGEALELGNTLLRGALATGLQAAMAGL
jgi:hypothetical protein